MSDVIRHRKGKGNEGEIEITRGVFSFIGLLISLNAYFEFLKILNDNCDCF
jgi:hypothetical protein